MSRKKQTDTSLIVRTTNKKKQAYKQLCIEKGSSISSEVNKFIDKELNIKDNKNNNKENENAE